MFGDIFNSTINSVVDTVTETTKEFVDDPIGKTVDTTLGVAAAPIESISSNIQDCLIVIDGLTECELREKAILRLGTDVVSGMAISELIEWYQNE